MSTHPPALILALAAALTSPGLASAQEPVRSFDLLNTRLKAGDTVWVTDAQGRETKGTVHRVTPDALILDGGRSRTFGAGDVASVREPGNPPIGRATFWGTLAGAGAGLALAVGNRGTFASYCAPDDPPGCVPQPGAKPPVDWWSVPIMAGIGAGIGAVVGALMPGRPRVVYVAPGGPGGGPGPRWSVAPVLSPRANGVSVSFAF